MFAFRWRVPRGCRAVLPESCLRRWILLAFALSWAVPLAAQYADVSAAGSPVAVDALWRFHTGDDLQWSSPTFDDSQWPLARLNDPSGIFADYTWYRIRLKLPAAQQPLGILFGHIDSGAEIFVDGERLATIGRMRPTPKDLYTGPASIVPLPTALSGRTIVLAIRVWHSSQYRIIEPAQTTPPLVGDLSTLCRLRQSARQTLIVRDLPVIVTTAVSLGIGFFSLGLFLLRRSAREYLWAACWLLSWSLISITSFFTPFFGWNVNHIRLWIEFLIVIGDVSYLLFFWGFVGEKADLLLRIGIAAALLEFVNTLLFVFGAIPYTTDLLDVSVLLTIITVVATVRLLRSGFDGNRDAWLLLLPFFPEFVLSALRTGSGALHLAGLISKTIQPWLVHSATIQISYEQAAGLLAYIAVAVLIGLRFNRSVEQEERLSTEIESARQVQEQLVPARLPSTPHFRFDAAYLAASEVGGDFYQVFPGPDGSVLVAIGDVSGKGLKAAMLGTLVVGALRALAAEDLPPAQILARLNAQLAASSDSSFVTCLCARIAPSGTLILANAGHLAPYCNGEELALSPGLPLGVIPDAAYEELTLHFNPGDQITFLSDGVVEARSASGELLGFDRTRSISRQSAEQIAATAQRFGQRDDITVLTLQLSAAEVLRV